MADTAHEPYRPSNGTEGEAFMSHWCAHCARERLHRQTRDPDDACPIATYTMALGINDAGYPVEWRQDGPQGPRCTAFSTDEQLPAPRCDATMDMFGNG